MSITRRLFSLPSHRAMGTYAGIELAAGMNDASVIKDDAITRVEPELKDVLF
jgi:hypothetical protein